MPTVPPACVPLDPLTSIPLPESDFLSGDGSVGRPTPDPDDDNLMLVQSDSGAIPQDAPSQCPPQAIAKPHNVDPSSLILHSPSSIIGTPFDPSPRFEYPFPPAAAPADIIQELEPIVPSFHLSSSISAFTPVIPTLPPPGPPPLATITVLPVKPRAETRNFSPTHPKLQARDPPIPPGLKHKLSQNGVGTAATIKIHGFDITALTLPKQPGAGVGRARGVSLSTLTGKHNRAQPLGGAEVRDGCAEVESVTKAGGIGEKQQVCVANKWKRHTLARCERDREFVVDIHGPTTATAKREPKGSSVAVLGGKSTRVPTRPPIPYVPPPAAVPSHRPV